MNQSQINLLMNEGKLPASCKQILLEETHISWVILCGEFAFKIKKPIKYSFLDFSTLEDRHFYCQQEVILNRRLAKDTYLAVVPIVELDGNLEIAPQGYQAHHGKGKLIDYAVMMNRMPTNRRMDLMLQHDEVSYEHIEQLATMLYDFHQKVEVIYGANHMSVQHNFNDLEEEKDFVSDQLGQEYSQIIEEAIHKSDAFLKAKQHTLKRRSDLGFIRECHGDLHSRNIFLLDEPVIFDCIEFNPDIRKIDILNELAFLCMDLEACGHMELSQYFMDCYTRLSSVIKTEQEKAIFVYFKAYRANVRAKVNILRAKAATASAYEEALEATKKYLHLMQTYLHEINRSQLSHVSL